MANKSLSAAGCVVTAVFVGFVYMNSSLAYSREAFGGWIDEDSDCINTRHEVLISHSIAPTKVKDCMVVEGLWLDKYTGKIENDPKRLDVDHVVSLKDAFDSGAAQWSSMDKRKFANDMSNLIPVSASVNRQKGAKGPDEWRPMDHRGWCAFADLYLAIKKKYDLSLTADSALAACAMLNSCGVEDG